MRRIVLFLISLATLAILAAGPARAQEQLNDAQITALLAGKSVLFVDYSLATYGADGSYTYIAANNIYYRGKYVIADSKLCLKLEHGKDRCDRVGRDSFGPYLFTTADDHRRFTVHLTTSPLTTTTLCGVPLAYTVYPPPSHVPAEIAAFSGTWVGTWDYGMCAALIVDRVKPNGAATAVYINGEHAAKGFKPGSVRFAATILDGKDRKSVV
jgi:hypothetical protein